MYIITTNTVECKGESASDLKKESFNTVFSQTVEDGCYLTSQCVLYISLWCFFLLPQVSIHELYACVYL